MSRELLHLKPVLNKSEPGGRCSAARMTIDEFPQKTIGDADLSDADFESYHTACIFRKA